MAREQLPAPPQVPGMKQQWVKAEWAAYKAARKAKREKKMTGQTVNE